MPPKQRIQKSCQKTLDFAQEIVYREELITGGFSMKIEEDQSFKLFCDNLSIIRSASEKNEADTRFRAIDTILTDVLLWEKCDINTEEYCRAGFADYVFLANGKKVMILEAKSSGKTFFIPQNNLPIERPVLFGLLRHELSEVAKAFDQAQAYAASIGCRYTSISNGHQWLIGLTFVENQDSDNRLVYIFSSIDDIKKKFRLFFKCFSPNAMWNNSIYQELSNQPTLPPPAKPFEKLTGYPRPANRNAFKNELTRFVSMVWADIESMQSENEFLEECYCDPDANKDVQESIKAIISSHERKTASVKERNEEESERRFLVKNGKTEISSAGDKINEIMLRYKSEFPYIVLGRVGHGKTTFLRNFRRESTTKELSNYVQIDINFLDRPDRPEEISQYVYQSIEEQLLENYQIDIQSSVFVRSALNALVNRFGKSPEARVYQKDSIEYKEKELEYLNETRANKHLYYKYVFAHIKGSLGRSVIVFLDNLDRRTADKMQESAFLLASSMARDWSCLIFITLRPGTFYHSLQNSVLDTIAPQVLTISPPRVDLLLEKRFKYSKRIAMGQSKIHETEVYDVKFILPSISTFLDCCIDSMSSDSSVVRLLSSACNGNMRELLNFVKNILTGGHLDTREILEKYSHNRAYRIPPHHIMRALLYGDSIDFSPGESIFINLFDIDQSKEMLHFGSLLMLRYLSRAPRNNRKRGFMQLNEIHVYLFGMGYLPNDVDNIFEKLLKAKYIEGEYPGATFFYKSDIVRITPLGDYHIKDLVTNFSYVDAIIADTPIIDDEIRNNIMVGDLTIFQRIKRMRYFIDYLTCCSTASGESEIIKLWTAISGALNIEIDNVVRSAEANSRFKSQRR